MQFYSGYFLNLLWLTPLLVICFISSGWLQQKRLSKFLKTAEIQKKLLSHYQKNEWLIRSVLLFCAFVFTVLALSQPQWGEEKKRIERKGVDVIFMLDVSTSMLAEDVKPSRVNKAKFEIESFIKKMSGDRVGMLTFAGSSFMQTPLTLDYSAFLIFLSGVDVGHVPDPGTLLGPAIEKAVQSFPDEKGKYKALIIFSDGEDHEPQMESAVAAAKQHHVRIYTIGTATADGAPIPLKDSTGKQMGVKKDRAGEIVITKLNREILEKTATETGGIYLPATPGEKEIDLILKHLASLGEKKLEDRQITEKEDHFQIFLFIAFACLILEMFVQRAKNNRATLLPVLLFMFSVHSGFLTTPQKKIDEGNDDFKNKRYQSAVQKYREVQVKNPDSPPVEYNLATSLYKTEQYQEAASHLKNTVAKTVKNPELEAKAAYNYGNALYRTGDYEGAIAAYKKALELNPKDEDAKYNLEFIQNKKNKFEKENQDRKKDNKDKKNEQNKQQNNKNQQQNQQNQQQQNQGGGSSQNQDKNQGQNNQQNQQGSGQQNKDKNQNEGGQGQNQQNSGKGQDKQDQKNQGQGQQDPKDQNQGGQGQDKKNQDNKTDDQDNNQKNQPNQGNQNGQGQSPDQKNNGGGSGKDKQDKQQGDQDKNQGQGGQGDQNKNQQPDQKPGQQPPQNNQQQGQSPQPQQGNGKDPTKGGQSGEQQGAGASGKPLQGQMTKEDAEYLLNSLEDGEKKFQVVRKPGKEQSENPYVEKDW